VIFPPSVEGNASIFRVGAEYENVVAAVPVWPSTTILAGIFAPVPAGIVHLRDVCESMLLIVHSCDPTFTVTLETTEPKLVPVKVTTPPAVDTRVVLVAVGAL